MATLRKQYISRGKHPYLPEPRKNKDDHERLMPNGIYAVRFILSPELIETWNTDVIEQWGLVMLDSMCKVRRHWNLTLPQMWSNGPVDVSKLELYKSTKQEQQFATAAENAERYETLYNGMKNSYDTLNYKLWRFMNQRAVRLMKTFHLIKWEEGTNG